ncbi:hypothetical protein BA190_09385 [Labrys sp. WJW]|uniref:phage baseplate assembly protein V n=1 Tax=Labrys sp. WJW TaxID=1737983 RepID=UPI000835E02B|nr:phage baseplate assembly protein V [Labrys sp. WJW]OCC05118.1 hypothetical protein BA190_09385 [Labrys sp. WJW]
MTFDDVLAHLLARIAEVERKLDGMVTQGPVHSVDADAGTVRLRLGGTDDEPFLSAPIPYAQFMGALKVHTPPSIGQQMTALAGAGDFRQGLAIPMTKSDANPSPSTKGDENVATYGGFRIKLDGSDLQVTKGGVSVTINDKVAIVSDVTIKGNVTIEGDFKASGGAFEHEGKNVGHDHIHTGVLPGPANTGPPA